MSITIPGIRLPTCCFKCPLSKWYDSGFVVGFQCGALLPKDYSVITNCQGRAERRKNCPIKEVANEAKWDYFN